MTKRYKTPEGFPRYNVYEDGVIVDTSSGKVLRHVIETGTDTKIVNVQGIDWKWTKVSVARLILMTFRPLPFVWWYAYSVVKFLDDNKWNVHIENLTWEHKRYIPHIIPGINASSDTFVKIPGFSRYLVNTCGKHCSVDGSILSDGYMSDTGYYKVRVVDDNGTSRNIGVHRLVALALLEHPLDVDDLEVNHKDGNRSNNHYTNLEWVTKVINIRHAIESGLTNRSRNRKILAKCLDTDIVEIFATPNKCNKALGIPMTTLRRALDNDVYVAHRGYILKYQDDTRPWPRNDQITCGSNSDIILVKDIMTNTIESYRYVGDVAKRLGCDNSVIYRHIRRNNNIPYKGCIIRYDTQDLIWPEYSEKDLHKISAMTQWSRKPVTVKNLNTGVVDEYPSVETFCKHIGYSSPAYMRSKINTNGYTVHNGYEVRYL